MMKHQVCSVGSGFTISSALSAFTFKSEQVKGDSASVRVTTVVPLNLVAASAHQRRTARVITKALPGFDLTYQVREVNSLSRGRNGECDKY